LKLTVLALILAASALPGATLVKSFREGNTIFLQLSDGTAKIEWLNDSSFRYSRWWEGSWVEGPLINPQSIGLKISETPDSLKIASKYLLVAIAKQGVLAHVAEPDGTTIMADAGEAELRNGAVVWERSAPPQVRFYGLGARGDGAVELRGVRRAATTPFLISSAGYGELHVAPGSYTFDLARAEPDRYQIEIHGGSKVDYYFFFGPTPKEILEQHLLVNGPMEPLSPSKFHLLRPSELPPQARVLNAHSLAETVHSFINGSLSGVLLAAFSLDPFQRAPEPLRQRAIQFGSIAPIALGSRTDSMKDTWRNDLMAYFTTYAEEARERGLPMIHALPMQFPKDPDAAKINDQFMLGDELLIAPILQARNTRSVYLPMGIWTRLSNNQVFQGKQTITVDAAAGELPAFSRNGAILPLGSNPMKLHYFPRLGGEFFLFESDLSEYSQVHAGPAGDFMRLETESKKERGYEWIVHHVDQPRKIVAGGVEFTAVEQQDRLRPGAWFYDATNQNLHVQIVGHAGGDEIINISF
jgi:hypothetical protein